MFERILCFNINKKEKNNIHFFLISNVNKSKKTKQLLGFFKKKENNANTKTNKKPGRKLRCQKTMALCWISLRQKKDSEYLLSRPLPLLFIEVSLSFLTSTSIFLNV